MDKNEIKIYTPVVWVEITRSFLDDNNKTIYDNEYLLWDGELEDFAEKRATKTDIYFDRYKKFVPTRKMGEFGLKNVKPQKIEEKKEVYKEKTKLERFNIYLISTKVRISKIVTNSYTKLISKNG